MNYEHEGEKNFYEAMISLVRNHGAVNNRFLSRFASGESSRREFDQFSVEFYHFSRHFPLVLCSLLINTANESEAAELTKILASELGDGDSTKRHELLYRRFLRSIGTEPAEVIHRPMLSTTRNWIETQTRLYSGSDHFAGLGASFGLENMAIQMWDQLITGLGTYRARWLPDMDMAYFTFHRALEEKHEDAMESALEAHIKNAEIYRSFRRGALGVLDAEEAFWLGLLDK